MDTPTYNMTLETEEGLKPHGFHLGTSKPTAMTFVHNALRNMGAKSVALYLGTKLDRVYDWRDLPENEGLDEPFVNDLPVGSF